MSMRLREMIKVIRESKTAAEERDFVAKECADIRTSFRKEETELRARNICKLIYVNLLGYATHFAQMDCLKLIVSNSYSDKRVGYLGLMMLLDERQEVLMLVTNSLKNDLRHVNQYVVGLALAAIGNIASAELARDCAPEVEKLLDCPNPYIRKKAALAAIRIVRKVPELMDSFAVKIKGLLIEKNHGVLVTGVALMKEMAMKDEGVREEMRKFVPVLVRIFTSLLQYGFSPEYDVGGVTDPFLQVKILRLMRVLGAGHAETSDLMNVILAGVATNTDNVRNVGNAILYECVNTIMGIDSEAGLRVLAINTLAKFLAHRDNNIRYVALNTLCTVVNIDIDAVQRHRNTIVDCLKDIDISIRRRALELVYALVNSSNVRVLVRELINFLSIADIEFRPDLTAKLCTVAEKFAPSPRWHIDTILRVMTISGEYVPESTSNALIALIAQTPEIQSYAVQRMFISLSSDDGSGNGAPNGGNSTSSTASYLVNSDPLSSQSLVRTAVWTIGEYGDLLFSDRSASSASSGMTSSTSTASNDLLSDILNLPSIQTTAVPVGGGGTATHHDEDDLNSSQSSPSLSITPSHLIALFKQILSHIETTTPTKHQVLTACLKLTSRIPSAAHDFLNLIAVYDDHINIELQQRATEYEKILETPQLPSKLLMRIPAPEVKAMQQAAVSNSPMATSTSSRRNAASASGSGNASSSHSRASGSSSSSSAQTSKAPADLLSMDLLDLNGGGVGGGMSALNPTQQGQPAQAAPVDLLSFLGSGVGSSNTSAASPSPNDLLSGALAGSPSAFSSSPAPSSSPSASTRVLAFQTSEGVSVYFDLSKPQAAQPQFTLIVAHFANSGPHTISDLDLKLSLPKYLKLQLLPISSTSLAPSSGSASQQIKLANTLQGEKPILMRVRLEFKLNGEVKVYNGEPEIPASF